jgi:hypothetical protein
MFVMGEKEKGKREEGVSSRGDSTSLSNANSIGKARRQPV